MESENSAQKYKEELENLRQQYADDLFTERQYSKKLQEERHALQLDYEKIRVQKGGFGLKAMTLVGFVGWLSGLFVCGLFWLLSRPVRHDSAFEVFKNDHLFNFELAISQGKFEEIEQSLQKSLEQPENAAIRPEIEFTKKIVGAARRRCEQ